MNSLQTDLEAVKKSVDAMWNSKIESQKLKIDSLTESLRMSENNLEHFRSNWIKEKEQNEELWKRVHILQQLFCQLRSSAVNSLQGCKTSTLVLCRTISSMSELLTILHAEVLRTERLVFERLLTLTLLVKLN